MPDEAAWACLLRGVNVGGTGLLPMAGLRALLEGLGARRVRSHIQSGNAVLVSDLPREALGRAIAAALERDFGLRRTVFLFSPAELAAVLHDHPFAAADPAKVQVVLLAAPNPGLDRAAVAALAAPDEAWHLTDAAFYLHAPSGIGRSVLAARLDRLLGVATTTRNLRTLAALEAMMPAL